MIKYLRADANNSDFQALVSELDAELKIRDGEEHDFYTQFNGIDKLKYVIVAYQDDKPVGCGAIKHYSSDTVEIKRMYVSVAQRGKGLASAILLRLEQWASELGYSKCILETGYKQPEAIRLYEKNQYQVTPNYGQYAGVENSICFEKKLSLK